LLTGVGQPLSGRLLLWDALTMTTQCVSLAADPRSREIVELPPEGYGETCAAPSDEIGEIDGATLRAAAGKMPQLLDVREGWERAAGSIEPSLHVPLGRLERGDAAMDLAALDPKAPTVVYCAHGVRSLRGAQLLRERHAFRSVSSLRGGYEKWRRG
jgi:sulfur-carrier protein adenylyltransferase/sulfurtransferase